ncbi:MAG: arylamine N-acetyltransferase [Saprospiraceae bacterium]|nr:arylamine N-acetyltransferase [Saprospiraceae bacterium]
MNLDQYLNRIGFYDIPDVTKETLDTLHECHILHIPFEDLNIHYNIPIEIGAPVLFEKVILHYRGGFCYELNSLFNILLQQIGFTTTIISARVFNQEGALGPPFDHMCIMISLEDKRWLADVGFGDLFIKPIEIQTDTIQFDSRNYFKIELFDQDQFLLLMSSDGENFEKKYTFNLEEQSVNNFLPQCYDKQHNPDSHFVKNKICTKATADGRITVFNDKLMITKNGEKSEIFIADEEQLLHILKTEFNIEI